MFDKSLAEGFVIIIGERLTKYSALIGNDDYIHYSL